VPVPCSDVCVRLGETVIRELGCKRKRGLDVEHTTFLEWEDCYVPMRFERKPVWPTSCMPGVGKEFLNQNPWCCVATAAITCLDSPA